MTIDLLEAARDELEAAVAYYDRQRVGLGDEFIQEIADAFHRISDYPEGWSVVGRNVRCCTTNRFPYGVMYVKHGEGLLIVAVAHLHRKPGYWRRRLRDLPG